MKKELITLSMLLVMSYSVAQIPSITEFCTALPIDQFFELTESGRDSLVKFGSYVIPGGDSIETVKWTFLKKSDNEATLNYTFTTGQAGMMVILLKRYTSQKGTDRFVIARYGGVTRMFDQRALLVYSWSNGKFTVDKGCIVPSSFPVADYIKPHLPDSVIIKYGNMISTGYDLSPSDFEGIEYYAYPQVPDIDEYLKCIRYTYKWDGRCFEKSELTE